MLNYTHGTIIEISIAIITIIVSIAGAYYTLRSKVIEMASDLEKMSDFVENSNKKTTEKTEEVIKRLDEKINDLKDQVIRNTANVKNDNDLLTSKLDTSLTSIENRITNILDKEIKKIQNELIDKQSVMWKAVDTIRDDMKASAALIEEHSIRLYKHEHHVTDYIKFREAIEANKFEALDKDIANISERVQYIERYILPKIEITSAKCGTNNNDRNTKTKTPFPSCNGSTC